MVDQSEKRMTAGEAVPVLTAEIRRLHNVIERAADALDDQKLIDQGTAWIAARAILREAAR